MPLKIPWPHPKEEPSATVRSTLWRWTSSVTVFLVGGLSKIWMQGLNASVVYNESMLLQLIEDREPNRPLLTVCNHTSTADDPLLFGLLPWRILASANLMRWGLGAHNVCFTKVRWVEFVWNGRVHIMGKNLYHELGSE